MASESAPSTRRETGMAFGLLFSCIVIWGVNSVAFKVATRPPTGFDPIMATGLRFAFVTVILLGIIAFSKPALLRIPCSDWPNYLVFGFLSVVFGESLQLIALRYTSIANLTLLSHGTLSLFTALWALAIFRQHITRTGWVGAAIALLGVAVIATHSAGGLRVGGEAWKGDALAVLRSVVHSGYLLMLSRWLTKRPALQVTLGNCLFGALWMLPYVLWRGAGFAWADVPGEAWIALSWSVLPATVYAFLVWNVAMSRVGAVAANNLFYLMPVSAAVAAGLILGETISLWQVAGGFVIICGILLLRLDMLVAAGVQIPTIPYARVRRLLGKDE